jgi:hypothetical protein
MRKNAKNGAEKAPGINSSLSAGNGNLYNHEK